MICNTSTLSDDIIPPLTPPLTINDHVQVGTNLVNDSYVWGPMRASQRQSDQLLAAAADQKPSAGAASTIVALNTTIIAASALTSVYKGDVAWSPPICFRSRYYGTYVLAEGVSTLPIIGKVSPVLVTPTTITNTVTFVLNDTTKAANIVPGSFFAVNSTPVDAAGHILAGAPQIQHVYTIEAYSGSTITLSSPLVATINSGDNGAVYISKKIGERRTESIYDAFTDTVLWTRSPLTDKRTLGDQ